MERFTPKFQGRPWVDGMEATHAYVLPGAGVDDELIALAHACRPALLDYPIDLACPPAAGDPGTLHLTIARPFDRQHSTARYPLASATHPLLEPASSAYTTCHGQAR